MEDDLSPTDENILLTEVQATEDNSSEIEGGGNSFFEAIATTIMNNRDQDVSPEYIKELAQELKGVMEFSNPGLISSLNTGDVGGLTAEELNVALGGSFTGNARISVTNEGIESAKSVFDNMGIDQENISLQAQIAMSGIMTQIDDHLRFGLGITTPHSDHPFGPPREIPGTPATPNEVDPATEPNELTCEEQRQLLPLGSKGGCFNI